MTMPQLVFALGLVFLTGCTQISAPILEETTIEYTTSHYQEITVPTLDFTLPYYPQESFHPTLVVNQSNGDLSPLLYQGLFTLDESFQAIPTLAQDYEVSSDGLTWTFQLREGVEFWDGTALSGKIVVSALNEAKSKNSRYASRFGGISSITATDMTVKIQLVSPNAFLPQLLDIPISYGGGNLPQGTGPYGYTPGEDVLWKNPFWWGDEDLPSQILLLPINGKSELISAFDAGKLSLLEADLTGNQSLGYSGNYQVWEYPSTQLFYLGFHASAVPTALRGLISQGIDRQSLIDLDFAGYASPSLHPVHPDSKEGKWLGTYHYDPLEIAENFQSYGRFPKEISLLVNGDNLHKLSLAHDIASQLAEFGLHVQVNALGLTEYRQALEQGDFEIYLAEIFLTPDFHIGDLFFNYGAYNYGGYYDPRLEALWEEYRLLGIHAFSNESYFFSYFQQQTPFAPLCFQTGTALSLWGHLESATPVSGNLFYQFSQWEIQTP